MRIKKIRGHNRLWKQIDNWVSSSKYLDLKSLQKRQRLNVKIPIHPWSSISLSKSNYAEPKRESKRRIIQGLIEIYTAWEVKLEELGQPYYLKIWWFEPRSTKSQVVCAIGDKVDFYDKTFFKPQSEKPINIWGNESLNRRLKNLSWEYRLDEDHFDNTTIGIPEFFESIAAYEKNKSFLLKELKKPHRTAHLKKPIGDVTEIYSFTKGAVWLGGKR